MRACRSDRSKTHSGGGAPAGGRLPDTWRGWLADALVLALASIVLAWPVVITYLETGQVPRLPTAVLSTGLMILASLAVTCGFILETVTRGRREMKRMRYLELPAPRSFQAR